MKKIILALFLLNAFSALAYCHPPKEIKMEYSSSSKILTVSVIHGTKDPLTHFIDDVEIFVNDILMVTQKFKSQTDKEKQSARYIIRDVKPGNVIKAIADCSRRGKLAEKLIIGDFTKSQKNALSGSKIK